MPKRESAIAKTLRLNLLEVARAYAAAEGITLAIVSARFYGNRHLLPALAKAEGSLSIHKYSEMVDKFREQWDDEKATWPLLPAIIMGRRANGK